VDNRSCGEDRSGVMDGGFNRVEGVRNGVENGGWSMDHRSRDMVEDGRGNHTNNRSSWYTVLSLNRLRIPLLSAIPGLSITLLPFLGTICSSFGSFSGSSSFSMDSKMFGTSSSNFRSFSYRCWANKGACSDSSWSNREVGGGNTEAIDRVGSVVGGLDNAISVDILVAATDNTEGVLGLGPGGVDVLVTETELTKLVLGVELTGGRGERSSE